MIKLVCFDLWNTLITDKVYEDTAEARSTALKSIIGKNGFKVESSEIEKAIDKTWEYFNIEWLTRQYTPKTSVLTSVMFDELSIIPNKDAYEGVLMYMEKSLLTQNRTMMEGMRALVDELKSKYILAIISDTGFTPGLYLREVLKKIGIYDAFSIFAFSDEIGVSKPHKQIFNFILQQSGVKPNEAVHIGDIPMTDVRGAKESGLYSVHFSKETYLKKDSDKYVADFTTDDALDIGAYIKSI